jgi:endonuclease/exonuclease/phosphatase family metal-dependent hydrolase
MPERTTLRVATYNIWMGGRGGAELDRAVRALDADVLLVNESPKVPLLWRSRCRRLADRWGRRFVVGGRPAGSNMILVRDGMVAVRSSGSARLRQPLFQPRRGIAWAQLRHRGRLFGVVCCHLSLDRERRLDETERVLEVVGRLRGPVVLAGDLNEPPRGPAWQRLRAAGFVDHGGDDWPTFPADAPTKRIDALLVRGAARPLRHGRPDGDDLDETLLGRASDHRPVLAELEIG